MPCLHHISLLLLTWHFLVLPKAFFEVEPMVGFLSDGLVWVDESVTPLHANCALKLLTINYSVLCYMKNAGHLIPLSLRVSASRMLSHSLMAQLLWSCSSIFPSSWASLLMMMSFISSALLRCAWHSILSPSISMLTFLYSSLYFLLLSFSLCTSFSSSSFCIFRFSFSLFRMRSMFAYCTSSCGLDGFLRGCSSCSEGESLSGLREGFFMVLMERMLNSFSSCSFMELMETWSANSNEESPLYRPEGRKVGCRVSVRWKRGFSCQCSILAGLLGLSSLNMR